MQHCTLLCFESTCLAVGLHPAKNSLLNLLNHCSHFSLCCPVGVDFIGPTPSTLIFTAGQTMGDMQCADVTIPDDSIPQPERTFNVSIGEDVGTVSDGGDGGGGGVRINSDLSSISVDIGIDINDRK